MKAPEIALLLGYKTAGDQGKAAMREVYPRAWKKQFLSFIAFCVSLQTSGDATHPSSLLRSALWSTKLCRKLVGGLHTTWIKWTGGTI
jgi:hypothetical protein